MKSLRIVMVAACPFPANHGSAASIREMSEALVRLGHEVHVVTFPLKQPIPIEGVTIHRSRFSLTKNTETVIVGPNWRRPIYDALMLPLLCRVIVKHKIDIIHAHNYEGALIGAMAKRLTGRPLLYNGVNTMQDELPTYRLPIPKQGLRWIAWGLDHWVPKLGDHITTVSEELQEVLIRQGISPNRITVVPAGVFPEKVGGGVGLSIRSRYQLEGRPILLYTGTLDSFQGVDYLLEAMTLIKRRHPRVALLMACNILPKDQYRMHQHLVQKLGLKEHVITVGPVTLNELPDFLSAGDVAVLPRLSCPGHPVKLLNYMAAGKPIVAFEGSAKGLRHMYNGYVVPNDHAVSFAEGILYLLEHQEIAKRIGHQARASVLGTFDWETLAQRITEVYGLLKGEGSLKKVRDCRYYPMPLERRNVEKDFAAGERRQSQRRHSESRMMSLERRRMQYFKSET